MTTTVRASRLRAVLAFAVCAAVVGLPGPTAPGAARAANEPAWLARLNDYREQFGVRPVRENRSLERGIEEHARYIVKTDDYGHDQNSRSQWSTEAGRAAGMRSNIAVSMGAPGDERSDVDAWMRGPFHALAMLDPRLEASGYENYYEAGSAKYKYGAGLDVLSARDGSLAAGYPLTFPGHGSTVPAEMTTVADETPNPLTPCGYTGEAGLPLLVTFGPWLKVTSVSSYWLRSGDGRYVEACATTAGNYRDETARSILAQLNTVVLIPKHALVAGQQYTASVSAAGATETFSFSVARDRSLVTAAVTATKVTCGSAVDVTAALQTWAGSPGGQPLTLWAFSEGRGQPVQTRVTDKNGWLAFTGLTPTSRTYYMVRFLGNSANLPSRSALQRVEVVPVPWNVQPDRTDYTLVQQPSLELTGTVPGANAVKLSVEVRQNGVWKPTGTTAVSGADGSYQIALGTRESGRHVYRVVADGAGCRTTGASDPFTVTVLLDS